MRLSSTRSSPDTLMTICPSICEMDSSTLSRMGCEKVGSMPGSADTTLSISSISCALVRPLRHCSSGLISTNTSAMLMVFGSVPSSGWPAFDTAVRTSGTFKSSSRTVRSMRAASSFDTLDGKRKLIQIVPSLSSGKNSDPRRLATTMLSAKIPSAMATTVRRLVSAQFKIGSYTRLLVATTRLSPCGSFLRSIQ